MKNILKSMMLLAAAATAFTACNKEVDTTKTGETTIRFSATVNDAETRATLTTEDEKTFKAAWETTDKMDVIITGAGEFNATAEWKGSAYEFTIPEQYSGVMGNWYYTGYYPSTSVPFGNNRVQKGDAYASEYDVMYGYKEVKDSACGLNEDESQLEIPMTRMSSILYFHLSSALNEALASATLTVEEGTIAAETVSCVTGNLIPESGAATYNTITLTFPEGNAPSANDFRLWYNILPGATKGLTLTVTTVSGKTATLSNANGKTYVAGKVNKVVKSGLTWSEGEKYYVKVTNDEDLTDGKYLIVYENGSVAFNGALETLDATSNTIEVQIADNQILSDEVTESAYFEIAFGQSGSTIKSASGYFIGIDAYDNGLKSSKTKERTNLISIDEDKNAAITVPISESNVMSLRYNKSAGQTRFRYFKSGQEPIALYKFNGTSTVKKSAELSFEEDQFTVTVGDVFTAPTLNNPYNVTVTWSSSDNEIAAVDENGSITIGTKTGTATITAAFDGNDNYNACSVFYSITVNPAPVVMTSLAELKEYSETTEKETEILFKNVVVSWSNGSKAYIEDETAGMYVYAGVTSALTTGDVLNGQTKVKVKVYNGQNEITGVTGTALAELKTATTTVVATTLSLAQVISEQGLAKYENMRVEIKNTTIAVDGTKKYLSDGDGNQIQLFALNGSGASISDLNAGDVVSSAIGYPMNFKSNTPELVIVSTEDIVVIPAPIITVSNTPTDNIAAAGAEITVNYTITNPVSGISVQPSASVTWINSFVTEDNTIKFKVDANGGEDSEERVGTVTVAYTGATSVTFDIIQSGNKTDTKQYFVKVTSTPEDLTSGTYLIVYEEGSLALTGSGADKNSVQVGTEVVMANNRIEATEAMKAIAISFENDITENNEETVLIKLASGKYIYNTTDSNNMSVSDKTFAKKYITSITISDGIAMIISSGSYLRYNNTATGNLFRFYKSTSYTNQQPVALYRLD